MTDTDNVLGDLLQAALVIIERQDKLLKAATWHPAGDDWPPERAPAVAQLRSGKYVVGYRVGRSLWLDGNRRLPMVNVVRALVLP